MITYSTSLPSRPTRSSAARSEEHTSELQSQSNLVCRLLLEKKKKIILHYIQIVKLFHSSIHFSCLDTNSALDCSHKFHTRLFRFESCTIPTNITTTYDVYPL